MFIQPLALTPSLRIKRVNSGEIAEINALIVNLQESMAYYDDGRDVGLHLADMHKQFRAIASILGYATEVRA